MQTLCRGLDIMEYVLQSEHPVGCTEVAAHFGINMSSTSRLLNSLANYGYLHKTRNYQYVAGMRMLQLASLQLETMSLVQNAVPYAARLVEELKAHVYLGVLWQGNIVQLHQSWWQTTPDAPKKWESVDLPIYASSMGKLLLAYQNPSDQAKIIKHLKLQRLTHNTITQVDKLTTELEQIAAQGYAINRGEGNVSWSVAAPVYDKWGKVIAAIGASTAGPASDDQLHHMLEATSEAGIAISEHLGYRPSQHRLKRPAD